MIQISIVEDLKDIRENLVKAVERTEGMNCVSSYSNAEEALLGLPKDAPDIVLMDIGLPKMNGVECMIRLNMLEVKMSFLMFTVFENDDHVFNALSAGASGYILKGGGSKAAIDAIREHRQGGAPMSREIARKVLSSFQEKRNQGAKVFESLTKQQHLVLEQLSEGLLNKEIADRLGISERTVKQHNNAIYKKLKVFNRTEAVRKYLTHNK